MKNYSWILVVAAVAPLFPLACGGGTTSTTSTSGGPGGAGGSETTGTQMTTGSHTTTGSNTTTGSATTTSATSTGAGGAAQDCTTVFPAGACDTCGEASCCAEGSTCNDTAGCVDCLADATKCDATNKMAHDALITCLQGSCQMECFTKPMPPDATCTVPAAPPSGGSCVTLTADIPCNPVTNAPCKTGQSCDFANMGMGYKCYDPPNDAKVCAMCDAGNGPFCEGGFTCDNGVCVKYCCTDADCGAGKCDKTSMFPGGAGECLGGNGGTTSSSASASSSAAGSSSSTGP